MRLIMRLAGKVAIVTGGGFGIGAGISSVLAKQGAKVVIADRDPQAAETAAALNEQGLTAHFVQTDVADAESVQAMIAETIAQFGALHVLVNNAGIGMYKTVEELSLEEWDLCLGVNLKGPFLCSKFAIPHLRAAGGGSIINISSNHAFRTTARCTPYAATKSGLLGFSQSMALDYGPENIRVNVVCPGWARSRLTDSVFAAASDPEAMRKDVAARQPMRRIAEPEDIGNAVLFLASDESRHITGTSLAVDGGLLALLEHGAGAGSES
jgi:NAD(P)-dependent dehydrogenase (short-subunit alcohol dehydrogenase family)